MPLLSGLITLVFCLATVGLGHAILGRWTAHRDAALRFGIHGVFGLATIGLVTLPIGLIPGGLKWGLWLIVSLAVFGAWRVYQLRTEFKIGPDGAKYGAIPAIFVFVAFICACGPSNALDWDSLAYHLAVPKLWNQAGSIENILFIHQSNFPFIVDNLFVWGLQWGGQAGAKAFMVAMFALGMFVSFGFARSMWDEKAGWWATLAFAGIPIALWESGTAYVDVPHGIFAGIGLTMLGKWIQDHDDSGALWLGAIGLGCAAASKYTGLQVIVAAAFVIVVISALSKRTAVGAKGVALATVVAVLIASPWLAKNAAWYGNPVYPFFYERLGGKNWDEFAAQIYRNEQQTFGVGRTESGRDFSQIGHAVLGLGYQPGRYVNPGQTQGMGFPTGALGFAVLVGGLAWLTSGKWRRPDGAILAMIGVLLVMWFVLSQQSRYLMIIGFPLAILTGAAASRLKLGPIIIAAIGSQAAYSLWLVSDVALKPKAPYALGTKSIEEYDRVGAGAFAASINALPTTAKVALYDEVFGFFLDREYFWANPGHSTKIPYDSLDDGGAYAKTMRELGFTHVLVSLKFWPQEVRDRWAKAAGLIQPSEPFEGEDRASRMSNLEIKWQVLIAEAIASGKLRPASQAGPSALLFELVP